MDENYWWGERGLNRKNCGRQELSSNAKFACQAARKHCHCHHSLQMHTKRREKEKKKRFYRKHAGCLILVLVGSSTIHATF
jgi:hypothetical protein